MALREADIAAELLAFTGDFTCFHDNFSCYSSSNTTIFFLFGQGVVRSLVCYTERT